MDSTVHDYNAPVAEMSDRPLAASVGLACIIGVVMLACCGGCASSRVDAYFMDTKSQANVYVRPERSDVAKIAVLPFKGPTELIGTSVSDMFVTEMLRANKYTLVERSQMAGVLSETELALAGLSESKAVEVARMLGADGVVIGTVDEYATQARSGKTYAVAGVSTRLIHTTTGQILWSADLGKMAEKPHTPLSQHGRMVVHEITSGLYQQWVRQKPGSTKKTTSARKQVAATVALAAVPLVAPQALTVSDMGLREVEINWKVDRAAVGKVRIDRAESMDGPFLPIDTIAASKGVYCDRKGLKDAQVYYYQAVTLGEDGRQSPPSAVVESMTAPPPDAPRTVTAEASAPRSVLVKWTPPRSEGVVRYRVERAEGGTGSDWQLRGETDKTTWQDGGHAGCDVADSTIYRYRVTAINRVGAVGAVSDRVEVQTLPPPPAPVGVSAQEGLPRAVEVKWNASKDDQVIGYRVERRMGDSDWESAGVVEGIATTHLLDRSGALESAPTGNLKDGVTYAYRVAAFNTAHVMSPWSGTVKAATKLPPMPPKGLATTTDQPKRITISWDPNLEPDIEVYVVESRAVDGSRWREVGRTAETTLTETGLGDGEHRVYQVRAIDACTHESVHSSSLLGQSRPLPSPPIGLQAEVSEGVATVMWDSAEAASEYRVYRKRLFSSDLLVSCSDPVAILDADKLGRKASVYVSAIDEMGLESLPSDRIDIRFP